MRGDESYGRNWGYYCLQDAFRNIFESGVTSQDRVVRDIVTGTADSNLYSTKLLAPYEGAFVNGGPHQLKRPNFFIVPQGRCAEALLFSTLNEMIRDESQTDRARKPVIVSNGFFDTTGANASVAGFGLQTFTQPGLTDPFPQDLIGVKNFFKGNLDIAATEAYLAQNPGRVAMILITITNNWAAAQPVSMANIRNAASLAKRAGIPLFFDACRFAENAFFIHQYEEEYSCMTISQVVQEMFSYVDGFTISLKKDGLANMGGVLCFRDRGLFARRYDGIGHRLKERQILCYGNDSYGGMSGRDLMAAAAGLYEVTKMSYLRNRIGQVQSFAQQLEASGIAVLSPPGGHALFLDMDEFFFGCDRKPCDFPAVGFTLELLKDYGIRAAEAGPFGWEWDNKSEAERKGIPNLVRFAVPRNALSHEHISYTVAAIKELHSRRHTIPNVEITRGKHMRLRHFQCGLKPSPVDQSITGTYSGEASRQLSHLAKAIGQEKLTEQLLSAVALSTGSWGKKRIPRTVDLSGWVSAVSNDHSPFEYSVVIDQGSGEAELRFLVEAQPEENSPKHLEMNALHLAENIATNYSSTSLGSFNAIRGIFLPLHTDSNFVAWFSFAASTSTPEWKIYLNPCVSGKENASKSVCAALRRLGLSKAWALIESTMASSDSIAYFSLDLSRDEEARVKVYVAHPGAKASQIALKHTKICPDASSYEIERFCLSMAGGSPGPYDAKPLLSCFAFTNKAADRPVGTVHFPVVAYAENDAEIQGRIEDAGTWGGDVESMPG
ncbi:putative secondary metabolism biosynthetic enzyme [Diatrype stigma]|uniref:Secondary metabolism biosynthetic enzyme n=1 Tax=Diatrype stigma TaxID=117547 RepID=A0AAN9YTH0_9PEZI